MPTHSSNSAKCTLACQASIRYNVPPAGTPEEVDARDDEHVKGVTIVKGMNRMLERLAGDQNVMLPQSWYSIDNDYHIVFRDVCG